MTATGARVILDELARGGVTACFTNPGTSEMHFVTALDEVPRIRPVLTLFEGVATGAADGFARISGRPAATLLHLGCGLGNGLANLHNARRARVPMVNVVGDHATDHVRFDAPLQSDIAATAATVSGWVRHAGADSVAEDASAAVRAAMYAGGQVATLIVPADVAWSPARHTPGSTEAAYTAPAEHVQDVEEMVTALREAGRQVGLIVGGTALGGEALSTVARIAATSGARIFAEVFPTRIERGAGRPYLERLAYVPELARTQLAGLDRLILLDTRRPVAFFGYPGKSGDLVPPGCTIHEVGRSQTRAVIDEISSRLRLADRDIPSVGHPALPRPPRGALTAHSVCAAVATTLPPGAIISDESNTSGLALPAMTASAAPHDVLTLTGGAIGQGLPVAVGAAVAAPDRPVLALQSDGSAMYTIQSLWTMAREALDVTVVLLNNSAYSILDVELQRVRAGKPGDVARSQLRLDQPALDFVDLSRGMGVPATRPENARDLVLDLTRAFAEPGPHLIDARIPATYTGMTLKALPYALGALDALPAGMARRLARRLTP
ncbi:acetolactate synthase large subunit [Gordonia alkanivorans]|uniref:acetolactate synthase n=1 Tax=Gordonia alkanivorans NBRC 16433 TaxID=1027371 RepID=F9W241_9ACTN|nr:acetolactate synthase large subunit [Gordonia alkanivorans]GAA14901.1 hypothetical protein GOALK_118_00190 [Gordonia alkanivorans NBRC 16433]